MCDLFIRERGSVFVAALHEVRDHVGGFAGVVLPALVDDIHVDGSHARMGCVSFPIMGKRSPREHEVYRAEAFVEVMVEVGEFGR